MISAEPGARIILLFALLFLSVASWAQDQEADETAEGPPVFDPPQNDHVNSTPADPTHQSDASATVSADLAHLATDPSAILTQFQNFFWTTGDSDDKSISNTYLLQPVLPLSKNNVLRPALPVVNTSGKTGFGDLFLLDMFLYNVRSGTWGCGIAGSVPIGSDEFTSNKWQAGPALLYMNKTSQNFLWGVLGYNQWSFAGGDSSGEFYYDDVNLFTYQPIMILHTDWGYVGWTDQTATYNWKNDYSSIPLGLRFGKVFPGNTPLNAAIGFYYAINNKGRENTFGIKFTATFIKPNWLQH